MASPTDSTKKEDFIEIPNLYHPYDIESGKWFYHKDVIKQIKREFELSPPQKIIVLQGSAGTGKTSTLKRMVDDPSILGESYISVYIDLGEIQSNDSDIFLLFVYKEIKNAMSSFGKPINEPDYSLRPRISIGEIEVFIQRLEKYLKENNVIILIFDELSKLQDEVEEIDVRHVIEFFQYIIQKTYKLRLILAAERQIFELAKDARAGELIKGALKINLVQFIDIEKIKNLIIEPVKNHLNYDAQAIQDIINITGANLYCQQLLCHYIVEYLNQEKRNICLRKDVHKAVQMTITDKREDFIYFWNNMSYEKRIVAATLADEKLIKQKGRYFFFEDSQLIDTIFDDNSLKIILADLYEDGYINRIEGRRFDSYPFKVPLYGRWIQKEHTLLKTVIENWEMILQRCSLSELEKIMEVVPLEMIPLDREIIETTIKLSRKWSACKASLKQRKAQRDQIEALLNIICNILGFEIKSGPEEKKNYFKINMDRLNLSGLDEALFFIPEREQLSELDILYIQDQILLQAKPGTPSFILCFKKSDLVNKLAQNRFLGIVILKESDLKKLVLSEQPLKLFKQQILLPHVNLSVVSPYKTEGPAINTFYGRQNEIGKICATKKRNFAIFGARKMGKTSLLYRIKELLPSNTLPIYMDLESPQDQNYKTFLVSLRDKMSEVSRCFIILDEDISNMRKGIIEFNRNTEKNPIFFLDEIDRLLKFDRIHNYQLMNGFRSLLQEGYCQVILSGFEELYNDARSLKSPLYNFCEFIELGPINREDALRLITEPMESIGVSYNNPDDKELILKYCYNHPNLLQFFCKNLITRIEEHEDEIDKRKIYRNDIEAVFRSADFEEYVINDFYLFMTEDVGPVEKLIAFSLLSDFPNIIIFTETEVSKKLSINGIQLNIGILKKHLDNLKIRYILKDMGRGRFSFAIPVFPKLLKKRMDIDNIFQEALNDAKKSL